MHTFVAYVPVLHEGYKRFFESIEGKKELFIFGPEITSQFSQLAKEIRQLDSVSMKKAIESLGIFETVSILNIEMIKSFNKKGREIILPDEDVSRILAQQYLPEAKIIFSPIFLRWDKHNALKEKPFVSDEQITTDEFHQTVIEDLLIEAEKSSDIWRHVAAAIIKDKKILLKKHNTHLPSEHSPYVSGDPRSNFHKGEHMELSTALHAEAALVAEAAKKGISLEGTDMYVTVFPCPTCAKLIANVGIKKLYCQGGYAVMDGDLILKNKGIKIFYVT